MSATKRIFGPELPPGWDIIDGTSQKPKKDKSFPPSEFGAKIIKDANLYMGKCKLIKIRHHKLAQMEFIFIGELNHSKKRVRGLQTKLLEPLAKKKDITLYHEVYR